MNQSTFNSEAFNLVPEITRIYGRDPFILRFFMDYKSPFLSLTESAKLNFKLELERTLAERAVFNKESTQ